MREDLDAALLELDRLAQMIDELLELSRAGERERAGRAARARRARRAPRPSAGGRRRRARASAERRGDGAAGAAWLQPRRRRPDPRRARRERARLLAARDAPSRSPRSPAGSRSATAGPGSRRGEEEQVFERFHRGGAGRRGAPGTGLGLPIARELARRWGGDVTLRARDGGGTVAEIRLPPA